MHIFKISLSGVSCRGQNILASCREADLVLKKRVEVANCQLDCRWGQGRKGGDGWFQRQEIHADDRERAKTRFKAYEKEGKPDIGGEANHTLAFCFRLQKEPLPPNMEIIIQNVQGKLRKIIIVADEAETLLELNATSQYSVVEVLN